MTLPKLVPTFYRSALRQSRKLEKEVFKRWSVLDIPRELAPLYELSPRITAALPETLTPWQLANDSPFRNAVRTLFHEGAKENNPKKINNLLDDVTTSLGTLNRKVKELTQQVYDTHSSKTTQNVQVEAISFHIAEANQYHFFSYTITITNHDPSRTIQLIRRAWNIIGEKGEIENVEGPGVIGQNPVLMPGESFVYSSGTMVTGYRGYMHGKFTMMDLDTKEWFDVDIAPFGLIATEPRPSNNKKDKQVLARPAE